ncbi:MAG: archaetidylserine decarboxylase, partial [Helicobacter sp.]|nr:archaetidylserine decarboxylase [Helicobacter sp.]
MNKSQISISWNRLFSRIIGIAAEWKLPAFLQQPINKAVVAIFKIDLSEHEPISHYASVNALFTRPFVRPRDVDMNPDSLIAPTDATLIASGIVRDNQALQIKGISYSVSALLAQSLEPHELQSIEGMHFFNLYLSPRDYHRFHAPTDLRIVSIAYCDGNLSSVRPNVLRKSPVFVSNERVILRALDSRGNPFYFVAVGAFNVGKILIYAEPKIHTNAA